MKKSICMILITSFTLLQADADKGKDLPSALTALGQKLNSLKIQLQKSVTALPDVPPRWEERPKIEEPIASVASKPPVVPPRTRPLPDVIKTLEGYLLQAKADFEQKKSIDKSKILSEYNQYKGVLAKDGKSENPEVTAFINNLIQKPAPSTSSLLEEIKKGKALKKIQKESGDIVGSLLAENKITQKQVDTWKGMALDSLGRRLIQLALSKQKDTPEYQAIDAIVKNKKEEEAQEALLPDESEWNS